MGNTGRSRDAASPLSDSPAALLSVTSSATRRLAAPKIAYASNYGCKHRCGKPGLPPPRSQTHCPAHSALCVPVGEHSWPQTYSERVVLLLGVRLRVGLSRLETKVEL
ncbi:unnamed protein product [Pleuronectes platessa]|uniref:Uncharacterized protein n=1 Tax=Pleuronectes platessa TaxID=8262 RepID=A0A9N7YE39_PLEPL|nr:unnamed protein product [Pleuronectes platessa]